MNYTSLIEIKTEFNLNGTTKEEVRSELRTKLANSHPDKVGAENYDSAEFLEIKKALDFVDSISTELIVNEQVSNLIEIVKGLTTVNQINSTQVQFNDSIDSLYKERKEALILPKISLSIITAILTFLWLFPKTVEDHPILKRYITFENETSTIIWILLLMYTIFFWLIISFKEQKDKSILKKLKTEKTQKVLFSEFRHENDNIQFVKSELIEFIDRRFGVRKKAPFSILFLRSSGIDEEATENLVNLIIGKAKTKGIITEISNNQTLDDLYEWQ